jgi:hypothetical protein
LSLRQFPGEIAGRVRLPRIENREHERQEEENRGQPAGELGQHVGRLRAENIFGDAATESGSEPFAFRPLHQDHEHHQNGDEDVNPEEDVDQNRHWDGQYDEQMTNVE